METAQITMITESDEPGVVLSLACSRLDFNPLSNPLCIQVFTSRGYSYVIQFHNEGERERWAAQIGTILKQGKGSTQGSLNQLSIPK
jgi:hypothetical protein